MKRLLTHSQLKHTKQAANKFLTCFIAAIMAVALISSCRRDTHALFC